MIPYSRQWIDDDDIAAVAAALRGDYLTTGPRVAEFEAALAGYCGARYAVAFSSGTAALHAAYAAAGVGPGDEVITSPITFCATANAALYLGGRPVFADVDPVTGLLAEAEAYEAIEAAKTVAVVPVDLAGHPCDYEAFRTVREGSSAALIVDACHSLGATYHGRKVGTLADMTIFSFHPVKAITTGEGGAVTTDDIGWLDALREFRDHGLDRQWLSPAIDDGAEFQFAGMRELGCNYRMTDFQAALGLSQLRKLDRFIARRREIAARYTEAWAGLPHVRLPKEQPGCQSAWHLYVLRVDWFALNITRQSAREALAAAGIGTQVHYVPVYRHPYYRDHGYAGLLLPNAERYFREALSVPLYPAMTDEQVEHVIATVGRLLA